MCFIYSASNTAGRFSAIDYLANHSKFTITLCLQRNTHNLLTTKSFYMGFAEKFSFRRLETGNDFNVIY
jgi:hypothetical protein